MKKIITILLLLSLLTGMAGAATVSISKAPTYNIGSYTGAKTAGTLQAGDLYATDDLLVAGDAEVIGTLYVGILNAGANVTSGHLTEDTTIDDGVDITAATGAEIFNYGASTGAFTTGAGTNTLSGNTVIAGSKTFATGTGAVGINGDVTIAATKGITKTAGAGNFDFSAGTGTFLTSAGTNTIGGATVFAANKGVTVTSGTSAFDFSGGSGIFKTSGGAVTIGPGATGLTGATTIANLAAITAGSGSAAYDLSASTGAFTTSQGTNTLSGNTVISGSKTFGTGTGAVSINGATTFAANKGIAMTAGTGAMDFSLGTGVFKTTTGAVTIGPGLTTMSGGIAYPVNATTTLDTTLTASDTKTVYPMDGSGASVTLTLPDPTTVSGRMYIIAVAADMGGNNIVVADTGAGKIGGAGGADTLTSTDASAALTVISNGTHYLVTSKVGTWS